jgi:hypothetical protein
MLRLVVVAALAALLSTPVAAGHGGGGALGFHSTITGITPPGEGVAVRVLDGDDRLVLRNDTGKPLLIEGYEGEPYLAFRDGRVLRNARSPATYLNDDRFGIVELPEDVDSKAPPEWEEVAQKEEYEWHDHRIHWMSPSYPPKVQAARKQPHHIFDWKVGGTYDGRPLTIRGSLDYAPPPGQSFPVILALPVALILALSGALVLLRRRRRARTPVPG